MIISAPRAAIFDVEGTLVDCVSSTLESWRETLLEAKYAFTLQDLQPYSGMDGTWMLEKLLPQESDERRKALIQRQGERYREEFIHHTRPFRGVNELLRRLKESNVSIGLATTCKPDELAIYDQQLRILGLIDAATCGEAVKTRKAGSRSFSALPRSAGSSCRGYNCSWRYSFRCHGCE